MLKNNEKKKTLHTREPRGISPSFPNLITKLQETDKNRIYVRIPALERIAKPLEGLNMFNDTNLTLNSDMDQDT